MGNIRGKQKFFLLKVKILFLRTTSASSISFDVVTSFSCHKSSCLYRADRPLSCGMLEYKSTTSTVHKIISSGKFGKKQSFFKESLVSSTQDFTSQAKGCK